MKKYIMIGILSILCLVSNVNAITTPIKVGDWITYKARFNFEGLPLTDVMGDVLGIPIPDSVTLTVGEFIRIIESTSLNVSVLSVSDVSIYANLYLYYNSTINFNENKNIDLDFPTFADLQTLQSKIPTLTPEIGQYVQINAIETSRFYAGAYRDVSEIYFHATVNFEQSVGGITGFDVDAYADWDKEFEVFLGAGLSLRLSSLAWISYNAVELYVDATNLWGSSYVDGLNNWFMKNVVGFSSNMVTYFVDGFVFGDQTSQVIFVIFVVIDIAMVSVLIWLIKKLLRRGG